MSDLLLLRRWFDKYLIPHNNPLSTSDGYVEDVTWEHTKDEDNPKGSFHKGLKDETVSELMCSQLGVPRSELAKYATAFTKLAALITENRFKNQYKLRKSTQFQRYISILLQLEIHATTVRKYDGEYGTCVPITNLITYQQ
jgi:hypothetical protein